MRIRGTYNPLPGGGSRLGKACIILTLSVLAFLILVFSEAQGAETKVGTVQTVTPQQYGAKSDGKTDDTSAIQAAVNTGRPVYLPAGHYLISKGIVNPYATAIFGAGTQATTVTVDGEGYDAFTFSASYSGIRDLCITAADFRKGNAYVKFSAGTRLNFVRDVAMNHPFCGIWIAAFEVETMIEDVEILNTAARGAGILIDGGNDTYLTHVIMDGPGGAATPMAGVRIKNSGAVWMTDCDILHQQNAIRIDPDRNMKEQVTWCFFEQVACDNSSEDGLYVCPRNGSIVNGLFFNSCWFSTSGGNGVNLVDLKTNSIDSVHFNNCKMFTNKLRGLWDQGAANVEINGCMAGGNSLETRGAYAGIEIADNTRKFAVRDTHSGSQAGFGSWQSFGLLIGTSCDGYLVTNNDFLGNAAGAMCDKSMNSSAQREVSYNLGFKTTVSGVATIPAGHKCVSVRDGLAGRPTSVQVTPRADLSDNSWWVGNLKSGTFDINTSANTGSDIKFSWTVGLYN